MWRLTRAGALATSRHRLPTRISPAHGFQLWNRRLPNVGKSTLFNATATQAAQAANYPFCTIEPNIGRVAVPDSRLDALAGVAGSAKIVPTQLEFVDIAGLVKGASKGEGLGNQFLGNIREVDAIVHVLRCFEDGDVTHVSGSVDPVRDAEIIETELMLADLDSLEKRLPNLQKKAKSGDKEAGVEAGIMERIVAALREGKPARTVSFSNEEQPTVKRMQLLTAKPQMYVLNVEEGSAASGNAISEKAIAYARSVGAPYVIVSAAIEAEVAQLPAEEQRDFLESLGLHDTGLNRVIGAGYSLLDLVTFFTVGPKEAHAWTVRRGTRRRSRGAIHTDFEGFIAPRRSPMTTRRRRRAGRQEWKDAPGQGLRRRRRRHLPLPLQRLGPDRSAILLGDRDHRRARRRPILEVGPARRGLLEGRAPVFAGMLDGEEHGALVRRQDRTAHFGPRGRLEEQPRQGAAVAQRVHAVDGVRHSRGTGRAVGGDPHAAFAVEGAVVRT